ncbi:MAG: hypothetical protein AAGI10_13740 [Pseudomonadota bacterium]
MAATTSSGCHSPTTSDPAVIRDRVLATVIEAALAAAVACPAYFLADQADLGPALTVSIWLTVAFLLAPLTLSIRALTQKNPAPEHRRRGLALTGTGCHLCRWIRFWWPLAVLPGGMALASYSEVWGLGALGAAITAIHLATALSALADDQEPYWAAKTGFRFDRRS